MSQYDSNTISLVYNGLDVTKTYEVSFAFKNDGFRIEMLDFGIEMLESVY